MSKLRILSKKNMYCELLFLFFLAPMFLYLSAIVYRIDARQKSVNEYFVELLTFPIISTFFLLLILNFFADFINYKKNNFFYLKKIAIILNLSYILFVLFTVFKNLIYKNLNGYYAFIFLFIPILILFFYKVYKYYGYYKEFF